MLRELHISNLAVIEDARIEFDAGLNVFTGATGAGKSLVIGAIELLLGLRSGTDLLRDGADEGRVSGVFEVGDVEKRLAIAALLECTPEDAGELLLVRRLHASGRSTASVNGQPITLAMLKSLGEKLVDIHGQHDQQFLLRPSNQIHVLDRLGQLGEIRNEFHDTFEQLAEAKRRFEELDAGRKLRAQQLDLLKFQADEIDRAELDAGELAELESRASMLANLERLRRESAAALLALYEDDGSILERLKLVHATLADLAALDPNLNNVLESTRSAVISLEESSFDLGRYVQKLDVDPAELAEVNDRLDTINRVLRKYGRCVEDVLELRADIERQIVSLSRESNDLDSISKQIAPLEKKLRELGAKLSDGRRHAAKKLAPAVALQLAELGMEKASFDVQIEALSEPTPSGFDAVEFLVQTNPGLSAAPLRKIASGGEIGRLMLAIKSALAAGESSALSRESTTGTPAAVVLVFDEIDANIGGRLGSVIGAKLRLLAARHQVLCITHLPQIAAFADRHLTVRKHQSEKWTQTTVKRLDENDRIEEIAEMIGGRKISEITRAQARELLAQAADEPAQTAQTAGKSRRQPAATKSALTRSR